MGLKFWRRGRYNLVGWDGRLIVRIGENRRHVLGWVVDDQFPAQLAVERTETRSHKCREVAFDNPLLQFHGIRCRLDDV